MTSVPPNSPGETPDDEWRDPDVVFGRATRLSDVGDRRLRDVRSGEPRMKMAWIKILMMLAFLVGIIIFHGEISDRAAGCYQTSSGLPTADPAPAAAPAPKAAPAPEALGTPRLRQFNVEIDTP